MREELSVIQYGDYRCRITPAHAGRIEVLCDMSAVALDHPRACGKNSTP